jgi:phasin family protein
VSEENVTEKSTTTFDSKATPSQEVKSAVTDAVGVLEKLKLPGFDLDGFVASRKLDIDAVTQATSTAFAGAQTIVDKQAEMLKTALTEISDALRALPENAAKPAEFFHKQQEIASDALSSAIAGLKDTAETLRKSQADILEIATNRVRSNVEEIRNLVKRPKEDNDGK